MFHDTTGQPFYRTGVPFWGAIHSNSEVQFIVGSSSFERDWTAVLKRVITVLGAFFFFTFTFQPNSWDVLPPAIFWTRRGHRCRPFSPPI